MKAACAAMGLRVLQQHHNALVINWENTILSDALASAVLTSDIIQ